MLLLEPRYPFIFTFGASTPSCNSLLSVRNLESSDLITMAATFRRFARRMEVIEDGSRPNRFMNKDIVSVPVPKRTYTGMDFVGYWYDCSPLEYCNVQYRCRVITGINASAWSLGSSNSANGLTAVQVIFGVLIGSIVAGLVAFLCGEPGVRFHCGFPIVSRAAFGIYGSYFPVLIKIFVNFIFCVLSP